ncbi:ABC transporter permease [Clostridiaceae bacterium M8S5]|nr:ABC transporter permease [Clostridiaceae bacterium M8S5]
MNNILILSFNTFKMLFRKKINIFVYLIFPTLLVCGIMYLGTNYKITKPNMGVVDNDNTIYSADMINFLNSTDKFNIKPINEDEINDKINSRTQDFVLVIPKGFEDSIYSGKKSTIKIVSIKGKTATVFIEIYTKYYLDILHDTLIASKGDKTVFNKIYNNFKNGPIKIDSEYVNKYTVKQVSGTSLGMFLMFIMIICSNITSLMLKEKQNRTYYRICTCPVNPKEFVLANMFVNLTLLFTQILLVLVSINYLFNIDMQISFLYLIIILFVFGIVSVGLGMSIVIFSTSSIGVSALTNLIIVPTCMLGGCYWPREIMPNILQKLGNFVPQAWAMNAIKKIQMGRPFGDIWMDLLILSAFASFFFLITVYKVKNNNTNRSFV